jgi:hypothetical protein
MQGASPPLPSRSMSPSDSSIASYQWLSQRARSPMQGASPPLLSRSMLPFPPDHASEGSATASLTPGNKTASYPPAVFQVGRLSPIIREFDFDSVLDPIMDLDQKGLKSRSAARQPPVAPNRSVPSMRLDMKHTLSFDFDSVLSPVINDGKMGHIPSSVSGHDRGATNSVFDCMTEAEKKSPISASAGKVPSPSPDPFLAPPLETGRQRILLSYSKLLQADDVSPPSSPLLYMKTIPPSSSTTSSSLGIKRQDAISGIDFRRPPLSPAIEGIANTNLGIKRQEAIPKIDFRHHPRMPTVQRIANKSTKRVISDSASEVSSPSPRRSKKRAILDSAGEVHSSPWIDLRYPPNSLPKSPQATTTHLQWKDPSNTLSISGKISDRPSPDQWDNSEHTRQPRKQGTKATGDRYTANPTNQDARPSVWQPVSTRQTVTSKRSFDAFHCSCSSHAFSDAPASRPNPRPRFNRKPSEIHRNSDHRFIIDCHRSSTSFEDHPNSRQYTGHAGTTDTERSLDGSLTTERDHSSPRQSHIAKWQISNSQPGTVTVRQTSQSNRKTPEKSDDAWHINPEPSLRAEDPVDSPDNLVTEPGGDMNHSMESHEEGKNLNRKSPFVSVRSGGSLDWSSSVAPASSSV